MSKIEPEAEIHEQTDSCKWGGGVWWKEGERTSQRTGMNDPCTWAKGRGLTVGERGGLSGGGQKGKKRSWENYKRIIKKNFLNLKKKAHRKVKSHSHKRQNEDLQNYH